MTIQKTEEYTTQTPPRAWRRYFARMLDFTLSGLSWDLLFLLVFHINPATPVGRLTNLISLILGFLTMLVLEPVFLHLFAATPGKWILGMRLTNCDNRKLSYSEARNRTWGVIRWGYGFNIPFYNLYRLWKSYKCCADGEEEPWDEFPLRRQYTASAMIWWRAVLWIFAYGMIVFITLWAAEFSALPPNRGNLTIAQYAQNYNALCDYYGFDPRYQLNEAGAWEEVPPEPGTYVVNLFEDDSGPAPIQYHTDENGYLTGFTIEGEQVFLWHTHTDIIKALAFIAAQPDAGPFSGATKAVIKHLEDLPSTTNFKQCGVSVSYDYTSHEDLISYRFTVTKEPQ